MLFVTRRNRRMAEGRGPREAGGGHAVAWLLGGRDEDGDGGGDGDDDLAAALAVAGFRGSLARLDRAGAAAATAATGDGSGVGRPTAAAVRAALAADPFTGTADPVLAAAVAEGDRAGGGDWAPRGVHPGGVRGGRNGRGGGTSSLLSRLGLGPVPALAPGDGSAGGGGGFERGRLFLRDPRLIKGLSNFWYNPRAEMRRREIDALGRAAWDARCLARPLGAAADPGARRPGSARWGDERWYRFGVEAALRMDRGMPAMPEARPPTAGEAAAEAGAGRAWRLWSGELPLGDGAGR